jgi:NitT/TauT family transport system substrate-binding protein
VFRNLNNPVVFNTVGKFARITDIAKVSGENIDELIHFINELVEDSDK